MSDDSPQFMPTALVSVSKPGSLAARQEAPVPEGPKELVHGDFIGRYRMRERIGEGGMGVVVAAEDPELGRVVAIKLLRPVEGSEAEIHQRRLLREAQALARVSHRNLVTVYDVGTHEGRVWIAMEYVLGDTLDVWLRRQRRTWREIVDVFLEAGRGLAAVHAAGLVHRDFKPGNVLVGSEGTVQVLDFGLAARAGEALVDDASDKRATPDLDALAATLTTTGGIMGTPAYMAPEQFLRLGADARADQFSFCVALYEALYGQRPWKGRDLGELMVAVVGGLTERPPAVAGMPDEIRTLLARGLRSSPEERYRDMNALLEVLEGVRAPVERRRSGGWRRVAMVLVGGTVLTLGARQWLAAEEPPADQPAATVLPAGDEGPIAEEVKPASENEQPEAALPIAVGDEEPEPEEGTDDALANLPGLDDLEDTLGEGTDTGEIDGSLLPSIDARDEPLADAGETPELADRLPPPVEEPSEPAPPAGAVEGEGDDEEEMLGDGDGDGDAEL